MMKDLKLLNESSQTCENLESMLSPSEESQNVEQIPMVNLNAISQDISSSSKTPIIKNFKCITWNLWCMPVGSPRTLSNPDSCANYLYDLAQQQKWENFDGLIVICLQELWCWKTGIFPPFLLRIIALLEYIPYVGHILSAIFQIISLILGGLPFLKCLPIVYDPKSRFINKMKPIVPYAAKYCDIPIKNFLDNGLLLMTNIQPYKHGFEAFEICACDDALANKGFIWCYFDEQKLLIINTHLQASGAGRERLAQVRQIRRFLNKMSKKNEIHKILVAGDFNVDMQTHHARVKIYNEQLLNTNKSFDIASPSSVSIDNDKVNDVLNNSSNDLIVEIKKSITINETNHLLAEFNNYENDTNEKLIQAIQIMQDNHVGPCKEEKSKTIDQEIKQYTTINIDADDNVSTSNNNDSLKNDIYNNVYNDVNNALANYALQLPPHKDHCNDIDPLTLISYDALPAELMPPNINIQHMGYVKRSYLNIPYYLGPNFIKINGYQITFKRAHYNIDHIFANFNVYNVVNEFYAEDVEILSDHRLIVCQFNIDPQ